MKASARRLNQVEEILTPKQRVFQWLGHAQEFESAEGYCLKMFRWPVSEWPGEKLTKAAAAAARERLKGYPREVVETAARDAVRDVLFLLGLVGEMNAFVADKFSVFETQAGLCARGLQLAAVLRGPAPKAGSGPACCGPSWQDVRREIIAFATQVSATLQAVALISRKFFDGHPILFTRTDGYLSKSQRTAETLVETYNEAVADTPPQVSKGKRGTVKAGADSPEAIEENEFQGTSLAAMASIVREKVTEAKARAAWQIGETELATQVLKGLTITDP